MHVLINDLIQNNEVGVIIAKGENIICDLTLTDYDLNELSDDEFEIEDNYNTIIINKNWDIDVTENGFALLDDDIKIVIICH